MVMSYAALRDEIEQQLQDSTNAQWTTAESDLYIAEGLRELANSSPHIIRETYTIESRTGTATATTTDALVDTGESQFLSGDTNKIIFNDSDNTWAKVTAFVSSSQLTLSKNIMASGENYKIFNEECFSNKEIDISDIGDFINIRNVEYPLGIRRNWRLPRKGILEIVMDRAPDDSKNADSDVEVYIDFEKRHKLSQLTDFAGAVDLVAGYAAGSTSMVIDALQATGTIEVDQEFTIDGIRGTYRATAAATIATNEATVTFYPGLHSAAVDNDVVTLTQSTLDYEEERLLIDLVTVRAILNKMSKFALNVNVNDRAFSDFRALINDKLTLVRSELKRRKKPMVARKYSRW